MRPKPDAQSSPDPSGPDGLRGWPAGGQRPGRGGKPDSSGRLRRALADGQFAVTAEIGPPRGASTEPVRRTAALLRDWVHAVNITDNQSAAVRLSSLAGSLAALAAGVEPIMQLTCRDRNRIALQSELLSAAALGIPNVLLMTGDHPRHGDHADALAVFDLDSIELLRVAKAMRDEGRLMSGRELRPPPDWLIGAVENPPAAAAGQAGSGPASAVPASAMPASAMPASAMPASAVPASAVPAGAMPASAVPAGAVPAGADAARLARKVEAGAQFVQTQFVFDLPAFAAWLNQVRDLGLDQRCRILAGVGPVRSLRALAHLRTVPGVHIPAEVDGRLQAAGPGKIAEAGERLCAETIAALRDLPGVAGVHVMAIRNEAAIPRILQQAGLPRLAWQNAFARTPD